MQISELLSSRKSDILMANQIDLENAEKDNLEQAIIDRLKLDEAKLESLAAGEMRSRDFKFFRRLASFCLNFYNWHCDWTKNPSMLCRAQANGNAVRHSRW